jgi:diaminopimelate decarboxylase
MENTPFYFYDLAVLNRTLDNAQAFSSASNFHIHYAIKANNNKKILETIAAKGFGADCVSGWEIEAAIEAGFEPSSIAFAGVGKTDAEIETALLLRV